ncbi:MAG: hypothetical protein AB1325_08775 [Nitrospirota bacterium]
MEVNKKNNKTDYFYKMYDAKVTQDNKAHKIKTGETSKKPIPNSNVITQKPNMPLKK